MKSLFREAVWAELQSVKEEGELKEYYFQSDKGAVRYRFFRRDAGEIDGKKYYDIASYRGAEGPYIEEVQEGAAEELLKEFLADFAVYCADQGIVAEFAKLDPWDEYAVLTRETLGAEYYGNFYCNDLTRDFYAQDYNRRSKRSIKKARNMGAEVMIDRTGETIPDFVRLYHNTEAKFHTGDYYTFSEDYIRTYFEKMPGRTFLTNIVAEGKIITSVLSACGEEIMHYLYLGNDPDYLEYQGNSLLTYETSLLAQSLGMKGFDMGGGKPGGAIETFKRNFISDDNVWQYYAVKKIWNPDIYQKLVEKKGEIKNEHYFPLYRG